MWGCLHNDCIETRCFTDGNWVDEAVTYLAQGWTRSQVGDQSESSFFHRSSSLYTALVTAYFSEGGMPLKTSWNLVFAKKKKNYSVESN